MRVLRSDGTPALPRSDVTQNDLAPSFWAVCKRAFDIVSASLALICAAPLLMVLWVIVRLDGGPGLFGHVRIGRGGREFRCLKLRSMVVNSSEVLARHLAENPAARQEWERTQKLRDDPRITSVGRFLRGTSLDELPQLLNIVMGDMSVVGPRPVVQWELLRFYNSEARTIYQSIRPGLTGLWQVSGRSDLAYDQRVELDVEYARRNSLAMDALIILKTVKTVLFRQGAR